MAFNPFVSFRKYQKFWMSSILLLCMVTFVLCTGVGGDLSDRLLRIFAPRHGRVVGKLDGRTIYEDDLAAIKQQRALANEFIQKSIKVVLESAKRLMQSEEKMDKSRRQALMTRLTEVTADLKLRLMRPRYFEGGTTLDDLVDFMTWKKLADKLDVVLTQDGVEQMFLNEIFARVPLGANQQPVGLYFDQNWRYIQLEARHSHPNVTDAAIVQALRDEFRVRIAQLSYVLSQPGTFRARMTKEHQFFKTRLDPMQMMMGPMGQPLARESRFEEVRAPLSVEQIWELYQQKRASYTVDLVPVLVQNFVKEVPDPKDQDAEKFFAENKDAPYDPSSPKPGFEIPQKVKVEWLSADPQSPFYKTSAKAVTLLETIPIAAYSPAFPNLVAAVRYGVSQKAWDASMARNYDLSKYSKDRQPNPEFLAAPLTESPLPALLDHLGQHPTPQAAAALVGAGALVALPTGQEQNLTTLVGSYRAALFAHYRKQLEPLLEEEAPPRVRLEATLAGLGASATPLQVLGAALAADIKPRFLPLAAVEKEFTKNREERLAAGWARNNMSITRDKLTAPRLFGNAILVKKESRKLIEQYGLEHGVTEDFYDRYTIAKTEELEPLRKAYEEYLPQLNIMRGKQGPEKWKEGDFAKLFFDVALGKYMVKEWPPRITVNEDDPLTAKEISLFDAVPKPFLYWKTDDQPSRPPESLKQVKDRLVRAWKMDKARARALPAAEKLAKTIQENPFKMRPLMQDEAKKLGSKLITLDQVAPLVPERTGHVVDYAEYSLPKGILTYPRDDMAKQVLALTDLQKPLKSDYPELDEINKRLFELGKNKKEKVQILTNKPHTSFYVGVVVASPGADLNQFADAYKKAFGFEADRFVDLAQDQAAADYRLALRSQLRQELGVSIDADAELRKSFDGNQ